jgi:hypothetical protein
MIVVEVLTVVSISRQNGKFNIQEFDGLVRKLEGF